MTVKLDDEETKERESNSLLQLSTGRRKQSVLQLDDARRLLIGAGARVLFYPTLFYNVVRCNLQPGFRWWDHVDQFLLLGAVPFPRDIPKLKQLGVGSVITLNEPFETLVSPSLYKTLDIKHLVIPTRDYLYAPSVDDINRAVDFIFNNASCGRATYVHCKAGRGRSTTIALCYLVKYKHMTPAAAMELIRSRRPRVLLTSMQLKAVQQYYWSCMSASGNTSPSDEVLVTQADLEGYEEISNGAQSNNGGIISNTVKVLPITRRLSTLIASLTVACRCVPISSWHMKSGFQNTVAG